MFLTLFYIVTSYLKMWQLQSIRTKLLQHVSSSSCVTFYRMASTPEDFVGACSSLCKEPDRACISDLLFVKDIIYGCALQPLQCVCLDSWRAPPHDPLRIAFLPHVEPTFLGRSNPECDGTDAFLPVNAEPKKEYLDVLLECCLKSERIEQMYTLPIHEQGSNSWKMIAWKLKCPNLALALRGDISQLTLLVSSFLSYETPINRIMTVKFDGYPSKLSESECFTLSQGNLNGSPRHCSKYLNSLQTIADDIRVENKYSDSVNNIQEVFMNHNKISYSEEHITVQREISDNINNEKELHSNQVILNNASQIVSKKSDLKLDLNPTTACEEQQPETTAKAENESSEKSNHKTPIKKKLYKKASSFIYLPRSPNIFVYSESVVTRENISRTLRSVLDPDRYAIYSSGDETKLEAAGSSGSVLLIAGGALTSRASSYLLSALLSGARVLSLCSDLLITVLPFYQTAEVRERELVSFSYEKWKSVKLLHHVFCYQPSPARKQFSAGPSTHPTEYKGHGSHILKVEVLAAEQTWHTPSVLKAKDEKSGGMAVFSQVHLELDSREYLGTDAISAEKARLGILCKILDNLGIVTAPSPLINVISNEPSYTPAYFLGTYERKQDTADFVAVGCFNLILPKECPPKATKTSIPLLLHACPEKFSTLVYFQELTTNDIGRLVIYSEILSSTQAIINEQPRVHGLVIIADRQTKGVGRSGTVWLGPPGCAMFSTQIFTNIRNNIITSHPSLVQHIAALACVIAIRNLDGYQDVDIRIKWPNDIYFGRITKLGGIILNTIVNGDDMIFNIGIGINLSNSMPTTSLNDIILHHDLNPLQREKLIALILNELEQLLNNIQLTNSFTEFFELYYKYWLHTNEEVSVIQEGAEENGLYKCTILGINDDGYLLASSPTGKIVLRPDGNTFDMFKGLIAPKLVED